MKRYLNCGCGNKYIVSDEWINIDFNASGREVRVVNLLGKLPFKDNSVDAVYSSCMLEHFSKEDGEYFVEECYRILNEKGILRIVVPDLENICIEYLKMLELCKKNRSMESKYKYIVIELIDQMTRHYPGGEMQRYWESFDRDEEYIFERTGYPESGEGG